jgi:hypothetical protein
MPGSLAVGIVSASNQRVGGAKLVATAAADLARQGHSVTIFVPLFPWYYYFVSLGRHPLRWLRYVLPHVRTWLRHRRFSFQELLSENGTGTRVKVRFVVRRARKGQLRGLDRLILNSIEQVVYYETRFPQDKQIYLLLHPEEHAHGNADLFQDLRSSFRGNTLVISPAIAREVNGHIAETSVVPIPVSPLLWEQRHHFDKESGRQDILLSWKDNGYGRAGSEILKAVLEIRPDTTFTVWCSGPGTRSGAQQDLPGARIVENLSEAELRDLYLDHSMLIFASTYEGFGMPPIEALACGCIPVLHPEVGAAELYSRDGENSFHLGGQTGDIASRIAATLDDQETLMSMRSSAPRSIEQFNPEGYGLRILQAAGVL